jgi:hypothetical protein
MRARDNPFAVHRVLAIRSRDCDWQGLERRLAFLGFRAALVGPHGSGKTTLLEDLGARLEARGARLRQLTLRRGERRPRPEDERRLLDGLSPHDLLLVDGADELGRAAWWRLRRASRGALGLLVTSHRPGLLPTLHEHATTPGLLAAIVAELLGPSAPPPPISPEELFQHHGGDLRAALRELYDLYADRPSCPEGARPDVSRGSWTRRPPSPSRLVQIE